MSLVVGLEDPIARVKLALGKASEVVVEVEELHDTASRYRDALRQMKERLGRAVTEAQLREASQLGRTLAALPVGVPLDFFRQIVVGVDAALGQALVRVGFRCNQNCGICWQDRDWADYGADQVVTWIEDCARAGARQLILSGGEPTLDRELFRYLRAAKELGFERTTIETNAVLCARPGFAERLVEAGLDGAFVSLHSGDPGTSDAITRAPGTHAATVRGVHALIAAGLHVSFNAVLTAEGIDTLAALPDFVHDTFGPGLQIVFSYPSDPFDPDLTAKIIPDPARLRSELVKAVDRTFELGLIARELDGPCGPPLCAFGADRRITDLAPVPEPVGFRLKLAPCQSCAVEHACFGVRPTSFELYGEDAVAPFASAPEGRS